MDSSASTDYDHIDMSESNYIKTEKTHIDINKVLKTVNERIMNAYRAGYSDGQSQSQEEQYTTVFQDGQNYGTLLGFALGLVASGTIFAIKCMQKN